MKRRGYHTCGKEKKREKEYKNCKDGKKHQKRLETKKKKSRWVARRQNDHNSRQLRKLVVINVINRIQYQS